LKSKKKTHNSILIEKIAQRAHQSHLLLILKWTEKKLLDFNKFNHHHLIVFQEIKNFKINKTSNKSRINLLTINNNNLIRISKDFSQKWNFLQNIEVKYWDLINKKCKIMVSKLKTLYKKKKVSIQAILIPIINRALQKRK